MISLTPVVRLQNLHLVLFYEHKWFNVASVQADGSVNDVGYTVFDKLHILGNCTIDVFANEHFILLIVKTLYLFPFLSFPYLMLPCYKQYKEKVSLNVRALAQATESSINDAEYIVMIILMMLNILSLMIIIQQHLSTLFWNVLPSEKWKCFVDPYADI